MTKLYTSDGRCLTEDKDIIYCFEQNFSDLRSQDDLAQPHLLAYITRDVSEEGNIILCSPVKNEEIEQALFSVDGDKASRPHGFKPLFYQRFWHIIGDHFKDSIKYFFSNEIPKKDWKYTTIALVPRKDNL